ERIEQMTRGAFQVKPGSLFPALHRLEQQGHVVGEWGESPDGYRVKTYRLAPSGRRQLEGEKQDWSRIVLALGGWRETEGRDRRRGGVDRVADPEPRADALPRPPPGRGPRRRGARVPRGADASQDGRGPRAGGGAARGDARDGRRGARQGERPR